MKKKKPEEYVDDFAKAMKNRFSERREKEGAQWEDNQDSDGLLQEKLGEHLIYALSGHKKRRGKYQHNPDNLWLDIACEAMVLHIKKGEKP